MTSTRFYQPELPFVEVTLNEHRQKTGHNPLPYETPSGQEVWVCTHRDDVNGNCFAAWPPPTKHELHYEKAVLGILQTGRFQVGDITVEYTDPPISAFTFDLPS